MNKILIVEDEDFIRVQIVEILELEGYEVICAENGKVGLQSALMHQPDLIVSDIMMPVMDGYQLLEELRKHTSTQSIPFIFLTAQANLKSLRRGMRTGADDYLIKPFTMEELRLSIKTRLAKHQTLMTDIIKQREQFNLLHQVDKELSYRLSPHWVTMVAIDWSLRRTNAKVATMLIIDESTRMLKIEHLSGTIDIVPEGNLIPLNSLCVAVFEQRTSIIIEDYQQSQYSPLSDDMHSSAVIPLIADSNVIGFIYLESDKANNFLEGDVLFLLQIAHRVAIAWEHANLFNRILDQQEREIQLREIFGRFVSKEVVELIQNDEYALRGEQRKVCILFCDIRGFTLFADTHSPNEIIALLNDYLSVVVAAAQQYGGLVNKFGGDSVLIIYGAPSILENCTYNAVLTAQQIQQDLHQLNEFRKFQNDEPIQVGIGINTGDVIAGAVGTKTRQEYTVIGDNVNLASRIESLTRRFTDYDILLSEFSFDDLGNYQDNFTWHDFGKIQIRGKHKPVGIYGLAD